MGSLGSKEWPQKKIMLLYKLHIKFQYWIFFHSPIKQQFYTFQPKSNNNSKCLYSAYYVLSLVLSILVLIKFSQLFRIDTTINPFYGEGKFNTERLSDLSKITQLVSSRSGI